MNILIIGSGGREDAFVWKFQQESSVSKIYVCPGSSAMERFSKVECIDFKLDDFGESLAEFAESEKVELILCGPEAPLTKGISKAFDARNIAFFGPSEEAASLEGSKIFSKEFMHEFKIPTAGFKVFKNYEDALVGLEQWPVSQGIVIKADGLAGGKGVVVTFDRKEAEETLFDFMKNPDVSIKTEEILFEHVLPGEEVSAFAFCNGEEYLFLGMACDHKRVGDGDTGPNTGGMGCYRDLQWPGLDIQDKIIQRVLIPTLKGMKERGTPFRGILFMGLMINEMSDPYVIEYNVRFGDPEAQTLLPLVQGPLALSLKELVENGHFPDGLSLVEKNSVHVVMTSGGYPSIGKHSMSTGHPITLTENINEKAGEYLFMAGVKKNEVGVFTNSGGRVLGVTVVGDSYEDARHRCYELIKEISFQDAHYRHDIGAKRRGLPLENNEGAHE